MTELSINWVKAALDEKNIACVDGDRVRSITTTLPKMSSKALQQALPHVLAKELIGSTDNLYFAHSTQTADGEVTAWCLTQSQYDTLLPELKDQNIALAIPDYIALPYYPNDWTIAAVDQYILLRDTVNGGLCQQHNLAIMTLDKKLNAGNKPQRLHLISSYHETLNSIRDWAKLHDIDVINESYQLPYLQQLPASMSLLDKRHQPKIRSTGITAAAITLTTTILAFIGISIGSAILHNTVYRNANQSITQQITQFKNTHLPYNMRNLSVPALQKRISEVSSHQNSLFNRLNEQLGHFLHRNTKATLTEIHFNGKTLQAIMTLPNAAWANKALLSLPPEAIGEHTVSADTSVAIDLTVTFKAAS